MPKTDYLLEQRLQNTDEKLHGLFRDSVFSLHQLLNRYRTIFPEYTDHSELHSLDVIDFCNALIGKDNILKMNSDEIYVLLMSCYLHDSGMGITDSDFKEFSRNIDFGDYKEKHPETSRADFIRDFHHEFSGEFIKKYADFFDIPSKEHIFAIVQVSRGHRKTDLYDENEYPAALEMPNGNTICLPYLAALIRLADELDISAERNLQFMYETESIKNEISRMEFRKHQAIKRLKIYDDYFDVEIDTDDQEVLNGISDLSEKLKSTLEYCCDVAEKRTPYKISQQKIILNKKTLGGCL